MTPEWEDATRHADLERVRVLIAEGVDVNALDRHGQTALMNAAHRGHCELVRFLVERGADLDHSAKYGFTALMLAIISGHPEVVRVLLGAGAKTTSVAGKGSHVYAGLTAEELAHRLNRAEILDVFHSRRA